MREIKFRGRIKGEKGWHYGSLIRAYVYDNGEAVIQNLKGFAFSVDLETVGQFTGLTDKNGVEIYEGDLISYWDKKPGIVVFKDQSFVCKTPAKNSELIWYTLNLPKGIVVGNIHDSPPCRKGCAQSGKCDKHECNLEKTK